MLRFVRELRNRCAPRRRRRRMVYGPESLESRLLLTMMMDAPPTVMATVMETEGKDVTITGSVMDENPGGLTVTLTGVINDTVVTDSNGDFTIKATASDLGQVDITTFDEHGQEGSTSVGVSSAIPQIVGFTIEAHSGDDWLLSGSVSDEWYAGMVVYFSGACGTCQTTVDTDGTFALMINLPTANDGVVSANTQDVWGLEADEAQDYMIT